MNNKLIAFNLEQRKKDMPEFKAGDVVKVYRKIQEAGKERIQIFEGMVIATRGGQSSSPTITVRKVSYGVGVELVIPVYSPSVDKIEIVKRAKVRRSKLYYVREKTAKSLRFKYTEVKADEKKEEVAVAEEVAVETPEVAEAKEEPKTEAEVKVEEPKTEEKVEAKEEKKA